MPETGAIKFKPWSVYKHTVRGKERTMVRGFIPLSELSGFMPPEEAKTAREASDQIQRLILEGGIITSNGLILGFGSSPVPMNEFARKRIANEGIIKLGWKKAERDYGFQLPPEVDGNKRLYCLGPDVAKSMSLKTFKAESVAVHHPSPHRSPEPYLYDLQWAFTNLVHNTYAKAQIEHSTFPFRTIVASSMVEAVITASKPAEIKMQSSPQSQLKQ